VLQISKVTATYTTANLRNSKGDGTRGRGCVAVGVAVSWNSDNTFSFFATTSTLRLRNRAHAALRKSGSSMHISAPDSHAPPWRNASISRISTYVVPMNPRGRSPSTRPSEKSNFPQSTSPSRATVARTRGPTPQLRPRVPPANPTAGATKTVPTPWGDGFGRNGPKPRQDFAFRTQQLPRNAARESATVPGRIGAPVRGSAARIRGITAPETPH